MWKSAYSSYEKSEIKLLDKVYYHKKNPVKNFDTKKKGKPFKKSFNKINKV